MPDEQDKERTKISIRIGDAQVELEGTIDNIRKLMDKELSNFTKGVGEKAKQAPPSTEIAPKTTPKTPEVAPKEEPVPPPSKPSTAAPKGTLVKSPPAATTGKATERMSKKKIISRNAAIALVLVLVLLASLVSVIAIYVPMVSNLESQIAEKDSTISEQDTQISSLQSTLIEYTDELRIKDNQTSALLAQLNASATYYDALLSDWDAIVKLQKSEYLLSDYAVSQDANSSTVIWDDNVDYAGCITVVALSTSNTTYVELAYSSFGVDYYQNVTVGTDGGMAFPVLPGEILITIGNTDVAVGDLVYATVTADYTY